MGNFMYVYFNHCLKLVFIVTRNSFLCQQDKTKRKLYIDGYIKAIRDHLLGKPYYNQVHDIIPISNRDAKDPEVDRLRKVIVDIATKQPYWGEERPTKWLLLADELTREGIVRQDEPVLQLNEVIQMAEKLDVSKEDVMVFLNFHHKLGDFIHFDEGELTDTVILNSQWLANMFRYDATVWLFHFRDCAICYSNDTALLLEITK